MQFPPLWLWSKLGFLSLGSEMIWKDVDQQSKAQNFKKPDYSYPISVALGLDSSKGVVIDVWFFNR